MTLNKVSRPALILVDLQKGFDETEYWGLNRNNPYAEENAGSLLCLWRKNDLPIFHVQHCSLLPESPLVEGKPGNEFKDIMLPISSEPVIKKCVNSSFIGTNLQQKLEYDNVKEVVVVGLTTDHCVSTTTRMAANLGYRTFLVHDATATFSRKGVNGEIYPAELIHQTALASLQHEFAIVLSTGDIAASLELT